MQIALLSWISKLLLLNLYFGINCTESITKDLRQHLVHTPNYRNRSEVVRPLWTNNLWNKSNKCGINPLCQLPVAMKNSYKSRKIILQFHPKLFGKTKTDIVLPRALETIAIPNCLLHLIQSKRSS